MDVTDAEALPLLADAIRAQGLQAVLPVQAASLQARCAWLRAFCTECLVAAESVSAAVTPDQAQQRTPADAAAALDQAGGLPSRMRELLRSTAALPDVSDAALLPDLAHWAAPVLAGARSLAQARALDWHAVLRCCPLLQPCL